MKKRPTSTRRVYLTVSGQLHLEAMCNGLNSVYSSVPRFEPKWDDPEGIYPSS
ncbi:Putative asparaginyl-tRNA synthetase_ mitochondrial [Caligus rogercresseyi]|uniref:Asparaginyl-tRNA synthetase_ mitochondrial n=1 Tax=Caligus rogercresseyi TaxID=217165 RepID=A0A7T8KJW2_CALRO|nr:Putative asparaginyl-tRNA synthetase_ mitochondrial [Caligus rogercresseyi]